MLITIEDGNDDEGMIYNTRASKGDFSKTNVCAVDKGYDDDRYKNESKGDSQRCKQNERTRRKGTIGYSSSSNRKSTA